MTFLVFSHGRRGSVIGAHVFDQFYVFKKNLIFPFVGEECGDLHSYVLVDKLESYAYMELVIF